MVGVERGCLVPIKLQRALGGWSGWQEDRAEDLNWSILGLESLSALWLCDLRPMA